MGEFGSLCGAGVGGWEEEEGEGRPPPPAPALAGSGVTAQHGSPSAVSLPALTRRIKVALLYVARKGNRPAGTSPRRGD